MAGTNIAQDELKAYVRRIESVEDEIAALNSDKSEIYKEAKSSGFDVKQLRKVVQKRRLPAEERAEQDTVFDLYWDAVHGAEKPPAHAHVEIIEQFPVRSAVAALRADPAMAIVEAADIKKPEPQPPQPAGSDLTTPPSPQGQVADIPEPASNGGSQSPYVAGTDTDAAPSSGEAQAGEAQEPAQAKASPASKYAAPGVVVWENTPPEGVKRHEYSAAFGELGQDIAVIEDDLANVAAAPIVKVGCMIIDGWARYTKARAMIGLDGMPVDYAVVQYAGTDPLMDVIRLNLAGRILNESQRRTIAQRLSRIDHHRKNEIYAAFELGMELVA